MSEEELAKIPRLMVLRLGTLLRNHSLLQLVKDFRNVMQPHTAVNLRERKANKLKDFIVMAGPLGVSDLFVFNQLAASGNILLRVGKMPRGPTLQFRVNTYLLCKDVLRVLRHPKLVGKDSGEFLSPPLLVLNGFLVSSDTPPHEKLLVTVLQNMFPPIQPQLTRVSGIRRVLMVSRDRASGEIEWRHYAIDTKLVEGSRQVKKLIGGHNPKKSLPNLLRVGDVSELLLDPYAVGGATSDLEVEDDAVVEIKAEAERVERAEEPPTRKRAIKLTELGPRLSMTLVKIEEGLAGSSKTIYHARVQKSAEESRELERKHARAEKVKAERRARQKADVAEKNRKKEERKARRRAAGASAEGVEGAEGAEGALSGDDDDASSSSDAPEIKPEDYENDSDLYSDVE